MKKDFINTPIARIALLCSFVILFLFIGTIFVYQYGQYRVIENRLINAYQFQESDAENLGYIFSTYSEAENNFRLYTLDFSDSTYQRYLAKLNALKNFVDSLTSIHTDGLLLQNPLLKVEDQQRIALEFAALKRNLDYLVMHTDDSLGQLSNLPTLKPIKPERINGAFDHALSDTTTRLTADTIIKKKAGLLKRIFNAKDDTIVVDNERQLIQIEQQARLRERLSAAQSGLTQTYQGNLDRLRQTFIQLQEKERQLITNNLALLNALKQSVETIETLNTNMLRQSEERDFALYKTNVDRFGKQLIYALVLMLIMIAALVYYQAYATSYERRLREEKDYAATLAEEKTAVLANISHEIRTPLNSLLGIIDLLKNQSKADNPIDEKLIDSAYYSINIISNNISDILSLSKLEAADKDNIVLEYFSPNRSFHEVVALHKNQAELKNLQLHTQIDVEPPLSLLSNEFRVKQIASNFLSNAIKYTQKGKIIFRASLSELNGESVLHLEVEDSGIGIKEEDRRQVFRKYFTANPNSGGIGLGLYITKIMAEELGGSIGLKSKLPNGSIFFLDIPFSASRIDAEAHRKATLADLPSDLRLLVVDDNPINILLMRQFFKRVGSIHTVNSGEDALSFLHDHTVDVVITDINMPGISGVQLLDNIRKDSRFADIPVLAISADASTLKYAGENSAAASFDGFIEKPFTEHEIIKTILKALDTKSIV